MAAEDGGKAAAVGHAHSVDAGPIDAVVEVDIVEDTFGEADVLTVASLGVRRGLPGTLIAFGIDDDGFTVGTGVPHAGVAGEILRTVFPAAEAKEDGRGDIGVVIVGDAQQVAAGLALVFDVDGDSLAVGDGLDRINREVFLDGRGRKHGSGGRRSRFLHSFGNQLLTSRRAIGRGFNGRGGGRNLGRLLLRVSGHNADRHSGCHSKHNDATFDEIHIKHFRHFSFSSFSFISRHARFFKNSPTK